MSAKPWWCFFSRSADDVRNTRALVVEREPYRRCLELRQQVCSTFTEVSIYSHVIAEQLPEHGFPAAFV